MVAMGTHTLSSYPAAGINLTDHGYDVSSFKMTPNGYVFQLKTAVRYIGTGKSCGG